MNQLQTQPAPQAPQLPDFDQESDQKTLLAKCLHGPAQEAVPHWGEGMASILRRLQ